MKHVELVAAARPLFGFPHLTGLRVHRESAAVAVSCRVDRRLVPSAPDEWIVGRDTAVISKANDFSSVIVRILRASDLWPVTRATDSHVEHAARVECDARRFSADRPRLEDIPHVHEPRSIPRATCQRCGADLRSIVAYGFVIRQVHPV